MEWVGSISEAIRYMEEHLTEELTVAQIAKHALISPFYFQKGFSMLCGFTVGDYIRQRRLALAGMYGINIDEEMGEKEFEYLLADDYDGKTPVPEGFVTRTIPAFTWAVFPCVGAMPSAMSETNCKIFTEWLPTCKDYEFAAGYNVKMYNDPADYKNGVQDEAYYSEIWIPVKKK